MSSYTFLKHRKSQLKNGQALVEFALVFPIFLLLVMGVIELGHLIFVYSSVYISSREAARYGAAAGISAAGVPYYEDCEGMRAAGVRVGSYGGVKISTTPGEASSISSVKYYYIANDDDSDETNDYATTETITEDSSHVLSCDFDADLGDRIEITTTVHYSPIVPLVPFPEFDVSHKAVRTILKNVSLEEVDPLSPPVIPTSEYGVALSVPDNSVIGAPGTAVVYTLSITNTGTVVDTYTLTLSGNTWATTLDAAVTVGAGATVVRQVTVQVPDPVAHGASDTVSITATSNSDSVPPAASDNLTLTTTAPDYGVELSIAADNLSAKTGETVAYDLSIKNTGNVDDSFALSLSGNTWVTSVTNPVPVAAGQTVVVQVYVTIPSTATRDQTDTVTVTARSSGDPITPPASDDITITTHSPSYGVKLSVLDNSLSARAGSTVTYRLSVTSLGNVPDSYTLSASGNRWGVVFGFGNPVACNPNETVIGDVTVSIDPTAKHGETDTVIITATSTTDSSATFSITLTTTSLEYDVDVSAKVDTLQGAGGTTVTYDLSVTNLGDIDDTYNLTLSPSASPWPATVATSVSVSAGATVVVPVSVAIPTTAKHTGSDTVIVTATSTGDPLTPPASDSQALTTTTPSYGVLLSVVDASLSGTPGSTISYALSITNTGTSTDTYSFSFTHTKDTWVLPTLADVTVAPGATEVRTLNVTIYKEAFHDESDVVTIIATSTGDYLTPPVSASLTITTTATRVCPYAGSLGLGTKSMNLLLYNNSNGAEAVTIERIDVTWYMNTSTQKLDFITLRGIKIMDTDVQGTLDAKAESSFPTDGGWLETSAERLLPIGAANHGLNIYFGTAIDTTKAHSIYIYFNNGCFISR